MSIQERELTFKISKINYYLKNINTNFKFKAEGIELVNSTYKEISEDLSFLKNVSTDLLVELAEVILLLPELIPLSESLLKIYFEFDNNKNNFHVRALLVQAQIEVYTL